MYTSIWHQASISSELYMKAIAVLSVLQLLCESVLKMNNYTLQKNAGMHLILSEDHTNGPAAIRLYMGRYF